MKILVTGGHGFVGRDLYKALRAKYPWEEILAPSSKELDLLDYTATETFLQTYRPELIFHLAARIGGVGLVSNKPLEFLESNLLINYNIVHAAISCGVKKFITLGSSCSYSMDSPIPNRENDLWKGRPENTYGVCKLVMLEHLQNQKAMTWAYLIPPNIYGPGDHFEEENAHFIPATVQKLLRAEKDGEREIEVWGDGAQTRDFVYIDDIIHFLLRAYEDDSFCGQPINIGTGVEVTVREVVETIIRSLGLDGKVAVKWAPDKPTGIKRKAFDNSMLFTLEPGYKFISMKNGLQETLQKACINRG